MGFIDRNERVRPLLAVDPETNQIRKIKILKDNIQHVETVLLVENSIRKYYSLPLSRCVGLDVFYAKRPKMNAVVPIFDEI